MQEIEVSWKIALRIWWSISWRTAVIILPTTFLVGAILGFGMALFSIPIEPNKIYLQLLGASISIVLSVWILKWVLGKSFNGYRIAIVKHEDEMAA
ncbi:hypothetical protein [Neptunicella marina]|uniref:Uncharacterized protein n=1 Tax=Neptunicella marina TaxID=2125989 RepID=A0A8J6ITI7_9ALTE|nr:hypothetical protein [Neptunicella marina]MBC3766049.1 hypothetical protein [Neptunicella marina]